MTWANCATSSPVPAPSARNLNRFEVFFASRIGLPAGIACVGPLDRGDSVPVSLLRRARPHLSRDVGHSPSLQLAR